LGTRRRSDLTLKLGSRFTLCPMDGLRVTELAESAGVPASTVRFYERVGLLSPARRTSNGYRLFERSALDELAFIARAKGIGMSLEDIAELVTAWPNTECRVLQARLRGFLAERISEVRAQRSELEAFEAQLQTVLARLAGRDPGPELCGKGCGCEIDLDMATEQSGIGGVAWMCSLDHDALRGRIGEWRALAATATSVEHDGDAVRLVLPADSEHAAATARLCVSETGCCPLAHFVLEIGNDSVILTAQAPGAPDLLAALFPQDASAGR
jgi:MerR family transcriptional regulator, copper efflux regulator